MWLSKRGINKYQFAWIYFHFKHNKWLYFARSFISVFDEDIPCWQYLPLKPVPVQLQPYGLIASMYCPCTHSFEKHSVKKKHVHVKNINVGLMLILRKQIFEKWWLWIKLPLPISQRSPSKPVPLQSHIYEPIPSLQFPFAQSFSTQLFMSKRKSNSM